MAVSVIPSETLFYNEIEEFPEDRKEGEQEFVRSILVHTRLIPYINERLRDGLRADWAVLPYDYGDERGLCELDIAIYREAGSIKVWDGNKECHIRVAKLEPDDVRTVIEVKKDVSLHHHEVWDSLERLCAKIDSYRKPIWLVSEICKESDCRRVKEKAYGELGIKCVFIFKLKTDTGEVEFQKKIWNSFFNSIPKIKV